jgi:hypothetical protein
MAAQTSTSQADTSELIVLFKEETAINAEVHGLASQSVDTSPIQSILDKYNASSRSLFGLSSERLQQQRAGVVSIATAEPVDQRRIEVPDLSRFHKVDAPQERLEQLAKKLLANDHVEAAYVKPPVTVPLAFTAPINAAVPAPAVTPNFLLRQGYLDVAPGGIDAKVAWIVPGGKGKDIRVIDCEHGWRFTHEDLLANQGGVIAGTSSSVQSNIDHGTAVLGIISGDDNNFGVTGITPDATISASSWSSVGSSVAIKAAADKLRPGDIILLEGHRSGPNAPKPPPFPDSQLGFIAIEWWPDDFLAVQYAVAKGIVVVAAAGNGFEDLDSSIYNTPGVGFPTWWRNPFNTRNPSSGAIIVGAGQCPPGTHGRATLPDRSRCDFSNWGSRVDVQGWGVEVTTTGYGYLQGGSSQDVWYTDTFNGTSSASPVVTGALISVQGVLKARGRRLLTSPEARTLLRGCGSAQQDEPSRPARQRIGNRPDLRALIPAAAKFHCRSADFNGDGRADILVTSPTGIALLQQARSALTSTATHLNGTTLTGGWVLNTADNFFGPVADYDGDRRAEVFVSSRSKIAILKQVGSTMSASMVQPNGTRFGGWLLNTADNSFGPAADFDGDGRAELLVSSPWGIGLLKQSGTTMSQLMIAHNGTRFGEWLLNTADNEFGPVGNFNGDAKKETLVVSPWGIGILQYDNGTFRVLKMAPNGTRFGGWLLNTADNRFGPVGDFDGDGRDEIIVTSPWGIGMLKLVGSEITVPMMKPNGTRMGNWLLNTGDNSFSLARDFNGDQKAELLVTSPWGMALLALTNDTMTPIVMQQNGTRFGDWYLNTTDNRLGTAVDFDADGKAELLVTSPWGLGILKQAGNTLVAPVMVQNGRLAGAWTIDTAANDFGHGV